MQQELTAAIHRQNVYAAEIANNLSGMDNKSLARMGLDFQERPVSSFHRILADERQAHMLGQLISLVVAKEIGRRDEVKAMEPDETK